MVLTRYERAHVSAGGLSPLAAARACVSGRHHGGMTIGQHSICRHCNGEIVNDCPQPARGVCKGWRHTEFTASVPVISHYCGGRVGGVLAEPHLPWRTGRHNGRTIYEQAGDEAADDDRFIGALDAAALAAEACAAHNYRLGLIQGAPDIQPAT